MLRPTTIRFGKRIKPKHVLRLKTCYIAGIELAIECQAQPHDECHTACIEEYCDHRLDICSVENMGYCNQVDWIDNVGVEESYRGPSGLPLYDGMPVNLDWEGNGYVWGIADSAILLLSK